MPISFGNSVVGTSGINGDKFFISHNNNAATLLLSDGASGAGSQGKTKMSECCVRVVKENPFDPLKQSPKDYIKQMIWKMNNELIDISQKNNNNTFGTVVICVVANSNCNSNNNNKKNSKATFASIGDSPAYLIHNNFIKRIAKTKRSYSNLVDMGLYTEEELEKYIHQLPEHMWSMFDRFIPMVVPSYSCEETEIYNGDIIAICSDGVSDYLQADEIMRLINPFNLEQSVNVIIDTAKNNAIKERSEVQYDDITLVLYLHE
ncbi:MAG: hypothetical protein WC131_03850 [Bacilli bacterium]